MIEFPEENDYRAYKQNGTVSDDADEYVSGADYRDELQTLAPRQRQKSGWRQKFALVFLSLFGLSAVVLWTVQFSRGLQVTKPLTNEELAGLESSRQAEADALRGKDTDRDGLSDYNEFYLYQTSPYLDDTDSDGVGDKQEVDTGGDPNCPAGQDCGVSVDDDSPADTVTAP